jgi:hypothetical protein
VDKLIKKTNLALVVGTNSWREQFIEAITVSAGECLVSAKVPYLATWSVEKEPKGVKVRAIKVFVAVYAHFRDLIRLCRKSKCLQTFHSSPSILHHSFRK